MRRGGLAERRLSDRRHQVSFAPTYSLTLIALINVFKVFRRA